MPAAAYVRQSSFSGGALDKRYWGRTDIPKYARALRTCTNWIPTPQGALQNRTGFQFVGIAGTVQPRLIPFIYSDAQSYVVELGYDRMAFWTGGQRLQSSPGTNMEIVWGSAGTVWGGPGGPYNGRASYVQVGDVMRFANVASGGTVSGKTGLWELTRTSLTTFSAAIKPYAPKPNYWTGGLEPAILDTSVFGGDATHPINNWYYVVTQILADAATGAVWETAPYRITQTITLTGTRGSLPANDEFAVSFDHPAKLQWDPTPPIPSGTKLVAFRVYKGRGSLVGNIGETSSYFFRDIGYEPDYTDGPPEGRNPMELTSTGLEGRPAGSVVSQMLPQAIALFEDREVLANFYAVTKPAAKDLPATLSFSKTGSYENFDRKDAPQEDTATEVTLAAYRREEVRWMRGVGPALMIGTNSSVWSVSGGGAPLSATNVAARVQSEVGSLWVAPVVAGDFLLYARNKGSGIRALQFSNQLQSYGGEDLSVHFKDRFDGRTVLDMAWCEDPIGILWILFDDGGLVSLTFQPETQTVAWADHEVDGTVISICSVPEGNADILYAAIIRHKVVAGTVTSVTTIERLLPRTAGVYLDCAKVYSTMTPATLYGGLDHLVGRTVSALVDGNVVTDLLVAADGTVTLPYPGFNVTIGLPYNCDAELLDVAEARSHQKTVRSAEIEVVETRGLSVGETFDRLLPWQERRVEDDAGALAPETTIVDVDISNSWNEGGRICIRQDQPLAATIVGVTRVLEVGGGR